MAGSKPQIDSVPTLEKAGPSDIFWAGLTLEQLAAQQKIEPLGDLDDLSGGWPENESIDELLDMVRQSRT